jgi:hypothetical protein
MSEVLEHIDNQKFTPANNVMRGVETFHETSLPRAIPHFSSSRPCRSDNGGQSVFCHDFNFIQI